MGHHQKFRIEGMHCANCAAHVQRAIASLPGVTDASVSLEGNSAEATFAAPASLAAIQAAVEAQGYRADPA